jgi:hypothetical protein
MHLDQKIPCKGFSAVKLLIIAKCSNQAKPNAERQSSVIYLTINLRVYFSFSLTICTK